MKRSRILLVTAVLAAFCGCGRDERAGVQMSGGGDPDRGRLVIRAKGCGSCHTIPGIPGAYANVGPSLERIAGRSYIAGVLQNTPANMKLWLGNPPGVDHLTAMPNLRLTEAEIQDVVAYLYTLR